MRTKELIINSKEEEILARVYLCLENFENKSKKEIVKSIIYRVSSLGKNKNAGYRKKKKLEEFLGWAVFGQEQDKEFSFGISNKEEQKIQSICKKAMNLCKGFIKEEIVIFIFPTFDKFVIGRMKGCGGFSSNKGVILITTNFISGWETTLKKTICHELAHAISPFYKGGQYSLGEGLILDGIAEHFREEIVGGERAPWTKAINRKEAIRILKKLKKDLNKKDQRLWEEVFFGSDKYPHWAGYSIGYNILEDYIKKQKIVNWEKIIDEEPKEILNEMLKNWKV